MLDGLLQTSVNLRLDKARECLSNAEKNLEDMAFSNAANRSYYCIFHSMRAVLATVGFSTKKHSGIISEFRRRYIKEGIFPKEFSMIIEDAFDVRNDSDYNEFYVISKEEVTQQTENAKTFLSAVEKYINTLQPPATT